VSARQLARLPLPADATAWQEGADLARAGRVADAGAVMTGAYGVEDPGVLDWWLGRLGRE
jgi:hypothetical protein